MKLLRVLAILSFVAGAAMLVVGFATSGGGPASKADGLPVSVQATPTPVPPTIEPTGEPTAPPTPTPLPEDGEVARLKIPKLKVDSLIESIGLLPSNQLDTPHDPLNTGWYDIYDKPGRPNETNNGWRDFGVYAEPGYRGNTVFSAHVDYFPNIRGPFFNLAKLELGDEIVAVMENGTEYRYRVIRRERYEEATIPMGDLIWPKNKPVDQEWVTLITCGGRFVKTDASGIGKYLDRDVVVAERFD